MVFGCSIFSVCANKFGIKKILIIGTLGYAPYSAALYVNNRYGTEWFVLFGGATCGIAASALWASEGAIALGYGSVKDRGKFSMWHHLDLTHSSCTNVLLHQLVSGSVSVSSASSSARPSSCRSMPRTVSVERSPTPRTSSLSACSAWDFRLPCLSRLPRRSSAPMAPG
jgi:hypothetical protein